MNDHISRIQRVRDHIRTNLDQPLNLDVLAEIACLSRFHWHRVYSGLAGETIWQTVRRMRLQRAAAELIEGIDPLSKIALRSGYANTRAFSEAFKGDYGLSPAQYQKRGSHRRYDQNNAKEGTQMFDVRFETINGSRIAGLTHKGSYMDISTTFAQLGMGHSLFGEIAGTGQMAAVYFDDPDITAVENLKSLAGKIVDPNAALPKGWVEHQQPAGRYAVLTHKGPYAELPKAYRWFYGSWLSSSGHSPAPTAAVEVYLNTPLDATPAELLTELWMAIN